MQCTVVPTGTLRSGSVFPALIGASGAGVQLRADRDAFRRNDVAPLAVGVQQQREVRAAVRVVLDPLDLRRDAVLVAAEIDDPVVLLVAAALVPHRDAARVVAADALRLGRDAAASAARPCAARGVTTLTRALRPGEVGLTLTSGIGLLRCCEVDFLPGRQAYVRLLPVAAPPHEAPGSASPCP